MFLLHGLKVPFRVIVRLVFNLKPGSGRLLKSVDELYCCLVEAGTKHVGLAVAVYGNDVVRISFSLMLIV